MVTTPDKTKLLTLPENVVTPEILTLSRLVCPSTSKSPFISAPTEVIIPVETILWVS